MMSWLPPSFRIRYRRWRQGLWGYWHDETRTCYRGSTSQWFLAIMRLNDQPEGVTLAGDLRARGCRTDGMLPNLGHVLIEASCKRDLSAATAGAILDHALACWEDKAAHLPSCGNWLSDAVRSGSSATVEILLRHGLPVDALNSAGKTALEVVLSEESPRGPPDWSTRRRLAHQLLDAGASSFSSGSELSPLWTMCPPDLSLTSRWLSEGRLPHHWEPRASTLSGLSGGTSWLLAILRPQVPSPSSPQVEMRPWLDLFASHGIGVDTRGDYLGSQTLLQAATLDAAHGLIPMALLEDLRLAGADPRVLDGSGRTLLHALLLNLMTPAPQAAQAAAVVRWLLQWDGEWFLSQVYEGKTVDEVVSQVLPEKVVWSTTLLAQPQGTPTPPYAYPAPRQTALDSVGWSELRQAVADARFRLEAQGIFQSANDEVPTRRRL